MTDEGTRQDGNKPLAGVIIVKNGVTVVRGYTSHSACCVSECSRLVLKRKGQQSILHAGTHAQMEFECGMLRSINGRRNGQSSCWYR